MSQQKNNTTIKAIIVDDEQSARDVLQSLLNRFCPQVTVVQTCEDVESATVAIKQHQPDVVFLDIEMPNYAGYEIVSFFDQIDFEIIFVTAYDNYAIKAFEIAAVDYLLKPLEISRLKDSIEKLETKMQVKQLRQNYQILVDNLKNNETQKIVIPFHGGQKVIEINEIVAIEAQESYSCIHTTKPDQYIVSKNLKHYESIFQNNPSFFRTHKSWIINSTHMTSFSKSKLEIHMVSGIIARLSKYKKAEFESSIMQ